MKKILSILIISVVAGLETTASAGIFDLYGTGRTEYGYGVMSSTRGYTGIAVMDSMETGMINPASAGLNAGTGFEIGLNAGVDMISGIGYSAQRQGFDYVAFNVPAGRKNGLRFSLQPISYANAALTTHRTDLSADEHYSFDGSVYALSVGFARRFNEKISAGLTLASLLGGYELQHDVTFDNTSLLDVHSTFSSGVDGRRIGAGLVYSPLPSLSVGITAETVYKFKSRTLRRRSSGSYSSSVFAPADTLISDQSVFPARAGIGVAYSLSPSLRLTGDFIGLSAPEGLLPGQFGMITASSAATTGHHIGIGLEKTGQSGRYGSYFERMTLRSGFYSDASPMTRENGMESASMGLTFGLGLPFNNGNSRFDLGVDLGRSRGTIYNTTVPNGEAFDENYVKIHFSFSSFDRWFNTKGKYR